jgi:hypothetical protein
MNFVWLMECVCIGGALMLIPPEVGKPYLVYRKVLVMVVIVAGMVAAMGSRIPMPPSVAGK